MEGITPVIDVLVPDFPVEGGYRDKVPPIRKKLELIDAPYSGGKKIIRIFLTDPNFTEEDVLNIPRIAPISFHGCVTLLREVAWLVSYDDELKPAERQFTERMVSTTDINLKPGASVDDIERVFLHIFEETVPPRIIDIQLGPGNVHVKEA